LKVGILNGLWFPEEIGSGELAMHEYAKILSQKHVVHAFACSARDCVEKVNERFTIHRYSFPASFFHEFPRAKYQYKIFSAFNLLLNHRTINKIREDFRRCKIDLLQVCDGALSEGSLLTSSSLSKKLELPFLLYFLGPIFSTGKFLPYGPFTAIDFVSKEMLVKRANRMIVVSSFMKAELTSRWKIEEEKVAVIPVGINVNEYSISMLEGSRVLFAGRLESEKGIKYLIEAAKMIPNDFELLICGSGGLRHLILDIAKRNDKITYLGYLPREELIRLFSSVSVFVCPSIWSDPAPRAPIEAMASGVPVVSTNVGGIPEWVPDGKAGFLVPPRNSKALAEAIIMLLENEKLRRRMGSYGRKYVEENFDWKRGKKVKRVMDVYEDVLNEERRCA